MQPEPTTVVVVEDDLAQQAVLTAALEARGMRVHAVGTGAAALQVLQAVHPDAVLLDLGLPDGDGLDVCRHAKVLVSCPIIVVTAQTDERRVIEALDLGADDYVCKPYSMGVLLARLRVALRHHAALAVVTDEAVLTAGDLRLDAAGRQAMAGDELLDLSARQFAVLAILVRNAGKVVTYSALARAFGSYDPDDHDHNASRVMVSKIRSRLGTGPRRPTIATERHVGYRLVVPDDPPAA